MVLQNPAHGKQALASTAESEAPVASRSSRIAMASVRRAASTGDDGVVVRVPRASPLLASAGSLRELLLLRSANTEALLVNAAAKRSLATLRLSATRPSAKLDGCRDARLASLAGFSRRVPLPQKTGRSRTGSHRTPYVRLL